MVVSPILLYPGQGKRLDVPTPPLGGILLPPTGIAFRSRPSPNTHFKFLTRVPKGIILHGSRSGQPHSIQREFEGTSNFAAGGANGLGWNWTIGEDAVDEHFAADEWGWNAGGSSSWYLACELAQPTVNHTVTPRQVRAFAWAFITRVHPRWPSLDLRVAGALPPHSSLPQGIEAGKSDIYPVADARLPALQQAILKAIYA